MNQSRLLEDIKDQDRSLAQVLARQVGEGRSALLSASVLLQQATKVVITGIGASLHAAFPLQYELASQGLDCAIAESGELLHYQQKLCSGAVVVVVSRSGESVEIVRLLSRINEIAAHTIGVTNEPTSTLATTADVALTVGSLPDEIVAIQSYTGTVAVLLLLAGAVAGELDARHGELQALLPRISSLIVANVERIHEWDDFFKAGSPIYLMGRGPSYASALEGALLFGETAKHPAIGIAAGTFRHGPVEIVDEDFRAIVFAPNGKTRDLNLGLAKDLTRFGAKIRVVGQADKGHDALPFIDIPEIPEKLSPLLDIIPVQLASLRLAHLKGLEIGKFRYAPQVTRDEINL